MKGWVSSERIHKKFNTEILQQCRGKHLWWHDSTLSSILFQWKDSQLQYASMSQVVRQKLTNWIDSYRLSKLNPILRSNVRWSNLIIVVTCWRLLAHVNYIGVGLHLLPNTHNSHNSQNSHIGVKQELQLRCQRPLCSYNTNRMSMNLGLLEIDQEERQTVILFCKSRLCKIVSLSLSLRQVLQ